MLGDNRNEKIILIGFYLLCVIFLLTPRIHGNDGIGNFVYLRSIIFDRDLDFTNEFHFYQDEYIIVDYSPITHRPVNGQPIGSAILWSPFYILAHGLTQLFNYIGLNLPMDGYSHLYVWAVCLASSFYAFLALLLMYKILLRFYTSASALQSIFLFWLASPLLFYMFIHPSMAHANSVFAVTLFVYCWFRIYLDKKNNWSDWILFGLSMGLMILVRFQDILFLLLPIYCIISSYWDKKFQPDLRKITIALFFVLLLFLPQLLVWKLIFGSYFSGPESHNITANLNLLNPQFIAVLFSSRHGLFLWHPVIFIGMIGLVYFHRINRQLTMGFLLVFIFQLWLISSWREWWGAHSFGHRLFLSLTPLFIIGLTEFIAHISSKYIKKYFYIIGFLLILWNGGLMIQYITGIIDRDGTTPFTEIITNQFTRVPEILFNEFFQLYSKRFP